MNSGTEIARSGAALTYGLASEAVAFDGYLYGTGWYRMGVGYRWAWQDGRPWFTSSYWSMGMPGFEVDSTRRRLYQGTAAGLRVYDAQTMALTLITSLPIEGYPAGYDPKTDQLYFLADGQLRLWPASRVQPPVPEPLTAAQPPKTHLLSLTLSPTYAQDKTVFGIWEAETPFDECWVWAPAIGLLYVSTDGGTSWSQPLAGLPKGCDRFSALAVSPDYAHDRTILAGIRGLGLFKSTDGGQLWQPASAGLPSMAIQRILLSPGFARDQTAFIWLMVEAPEDELYRTRDGGRTWQKLGMNLDLLAMSLEFDRDHTLMGVAKDGTELRISRDGGDSWGRVSDTLNGQAIGFLSLAPSFDKWHVLFAYGNGTLYRSDDGGRSWDAVLNLTMLNCTGVLHLP
jgi:hypothetical protein